ncbi:MAG: hydroxypyruvate isomerase family protein [Aquaspirillum sp.]
MPRFAANLSLMFTEVPWAERLHAARMAGFDRVEIQFPYAIPLSDWQQWQRESGVEIVLINAPAGDLMSGGAGLAAVAGQEQAFQSGIEQALRYAEGLGVSCVNVLAGRLAPDHQTAQAWALLTQNVQYACQRFAEHLDCTLTSEAINPFDMPGFLVNRGEDMLRLLELVDCPNFGLQVDIYHFARQQLPILPFIEQHLSQLAHIQFADCPGRREPGSGELDFVEIFSAIDRLGYRGVVTAEYHPSVQTEHTLFWLEVD